MGFRGWTSARRTRSLSYRAARSRSCSCTPVRGGARGKARGRGRGRVRVRVAVELRADLLAVAEGEERGAVPRLLDACIVLEHLDHLVRVRG